MSAGEAHPLRRLAVLSDRMPDKEVLVGYDVRGSQHAGQLVGRSAVTARGLWESVNAVALGLQRCGVEPSDVVAVQLPNWPEYVEVHLGALLAGVVTMPVSPIMGKRDLMSQMSKARATVLVTSGSSPVVVEQPIALTLDELPHLKLVVAVRDEGQQTNGVVSLEDLTVLGREDSDSLDGQELAKLQRVQTEDSPVVLNFTSGSSGSPKGVLHSMRSVSAQIEPLASTMGLGADDVFMVATTIGHAAGFLNGVYMPLHLGAKTILMDRWDPEVAIAIIEREGVSYAPAMPTYLVDLLSSPSIATGKLSTWRKARVSGGPINRDLLARMAAALPDLMTFPGWGLTECMLVTGSGPDDPVDKRMTTDGKPLGGAVVAIRDSSLRYDLPNGQVGEVVVRSDSQMVGYFEPDETTPDPRIEGGWLHTGDLGTLDADGYLRISGRSKDIVVRGGENIPVVEVEQLILGHPGVSQACVVGVPHDRLGEQACAVLVMHAGHESVDLGELATFLKTSGLTRQFIPERLVIVPKLPETSVGKIRRDEVRRLVLEPSSKPPHHA